MSKPLLFNDLIKSPSVSAVHMPSSNTGAWGDRRLRRYDGNTAKSPFSYAGNVLGMVRPDQMPRFLAALTDPDELTTKTFEMKALTALQNRVDPGKVEGMARSGKYMKPPVVVRMGGRHVIADGHHRATALWLRGDNEVRARFKDLSRYSNALKRQAPVLKVDEELRQVAGWASVATINGELVVDKQADIIEPAELQRAAHDFMLSGGTLGDMHERVGMGRLIESVVTTQETQKALFDPTIEGWWVRFQVDDDALWKRIKAGELPEFSIGGRAIPVDV